MALDYVEEQRAAFESAIEALETGRDRIRAFRRSLGNSHPTDEPYPVYLIDDYAPYWIHESSRLWIELAASWSEIGKS